MTQVRRRNFLAAAIGACSGLAPWLVVAQPRAVRIGYLAPRQGSVFLPPILKRLSELGYVQGRNLAVEYRSAEGAAERFPTLARELIDAKCDLIFAAGVLLAARALIDARTSIPIVFIASDYDPVRQGIVSNLRRPGGNMTGIALLNAELSAKHVEILREIAPGTKRLLIFGDGFNKELFEAARLAAERQRIEVITATFSKPPYEFEAAFENGVKSGADALLLVTSPVFFDRRTTIYELAMKRRLPVAVGSSLWWSEPGWLVGYGIKPDKTYARAGDIAASILQGKKAGDLPVEQPTDFEFAINLRTAKALGIRIPQTMLMRADRVIE